MTEGRILLTTHDLQTAGPVRDAFRDEGYEVELVTPDEEMEGFSDAVLLVLTGGLETEGAEKMAGGWASRQNVPVFGVTDESEESWRRLRRELGLEEVFFRPVDPAEVLLLGHTLVERRRLREVTGIVGDTEVMREVLEQVVQIAPVPSTVLITGESGTGKELVARGIHALSPRRHNAFIAVNVAALSETLLESELFGHEKGAFTGAVDTRKGFFELASGGTIFLDEIGEMPLATQTKLLRVLEQREFLRVGGEAPIRVDVRIVAATNQDLRQLVAIGEFRRDLYYRLNVLRIRMPPLRERKEDIPRLVRAFIEEISESHDRTFAGISEDGMAILQEYYWPGNVRELRNLVESMVVLSPGREIQPRDIPDEIRHPDQGMALLPRHVGGLSPAPSAERRRGGGPEDEGRGGLEPEGGGGDYRPQLEFIFRTLMELRLDLSDLQQEFEAYKSQSPVPGRAMREISLPEGDEGYEGPVVSREPGVSRQSEAAREGGAEDGGISGGPAPAREGNGEPRAPAAEDEGAVVYRPGMTMEDLERKAILAALEEVGGNRRRAAEMLAIGERTLYRKIQKYELDV